MNLLCSFAEDDSSNKVDPDAEIENLDEAEVFVKLIAL